MKKNKILGGQISIFFVIGILIVLILIAILFVYKDIKKEEIWPLQETSIHHKIVEDNINRCFTAIVKDALITIGERGGYYFPTNISFITYNGTLVALHNFSKSKEEYRNILESEIERYINTKIIKCLDPSLFPSINLTFGSPSIKTKIETEKVTSDLSLQTFIDGNPGPSSFHTHAEVKLNKILDFIYNQKPGDKELCLTCIIQEGSGADMEIKITRYANHTIIKIRDHVSKIDGEDFLFTYAI